MKKKRNKSLWAVTIVFCLTMVVVTGACGRRPRNVISEDKMVDLMVDMEIAEAYVSTTHSASGTERIEMGKRVLKSHDISEEQLDTTLAWYGRNMDEYTKLFEKVDKEIEKRQKKYTEVPGLMPKESDNLWPYNQHLILSPLSGSEIFSFSLPSPQVEKGDRIKLTFAMPNQFGLKTTLGVEYTNGTGDAIVSNNSARKNLDITLHTDTSKTVSRIFGILNVKDIKNQTVYFDSIRIVTEPFDSLSYVSGRRSQKSFSTIVI